MSIVECSYFECKNNTRTTPGIRFFRIPVRLHEEWVKNCGKIFYVLNFTVQSVTLSSWFQYTVLYIGFRGVCKGRSYFPFSLLGGGGLDSETGEKIY